VTSIEDLHCDAGWRVLSFLKVTTDEGVVGWSEYNESYGNPGLTAVIRRMAAELVGADPRPVERIDARLVAMSRLVQGGMAQQAVAAIGNALLDVKARALGVPVYELLGGPVRDRVPVYWSHCGLYRLSHADLIGVEPVRTLDDLAAMGAEVARRGFRALKTNIFELDREQPRIYLPGFAASEGWPASNPDPVMIGAGREQLEAFRAGAGPDVEIMLDLSWNGQPAAFHRFAEAYADLDLAWLEVDSTEATALAELRRRARMPIASLEAMYRQSSYRPFLEARAVDVCIVDVPWNGLLESLKIAHLAAAFDVNIAPHNFYGHLSTLMSATLCALVPNVRVLETDIDDVPWKDELVSVPPVIEDGELVLPTGPGWGVEIDEDVVRAHPPRSTAFSSYEKGRG
jgi:L-alanine-DL-glutamate epimerase-like enolase superfamily enzyme